MRIIALCAVSNISQPYAGKGGPSCGKEKIDFTHLIFRYAAAVVSHLKEQVGLAGDTAGNLQTALAGQILKSVNQGVFQKRL